MNALPSRSPVDRLRRALAGALRLAATVTATICRPRSRPAEKSLRVLAELDEDQLSNLSETGLSLRRDARRAAASGGGDA
ncbi:MAG: hypothetical protein K0S06_3216 [Microvirga sp.]|jgi:hypothetical protein|nr:hypothetical protein [Microvirga sp.]